MVSRSSTSTVWLGAGLVKGKFLRRLNRFAVLFESDGKVSEAFMPNSGRLLELLKPAASLILKRKMEGKSSFELLAVRTNGMVVPIGSRLPNKLFHLAVVQRFLPPFAAYTDVKPEYRYGSSRLDFLLSNDTERCLVEMKSCTLVKGGVALFPDAPTERGTKHVLELLKAKQESFRACVVFIVQRSDAVVMRPYWENDARFGEAVWEASRKGVEIFAWKVRPVDESLRITIGDQIPVEIGRGIG
ncbi:MAG: DNA/RNA nuclease SfsA [Thaumarchaeota archaeon]|nr:DNA/RNA nuclease SfsA [Nitrososphaerota archaeon]